ncbi:MAG: hypothetical protein WD872_10360 [Pirellulaceae bacterium]
MLARHAYRQWESVAWALAALAGLAQPARADVFHLVSGGRIEGEWLNRDQQQPHEYLVRTRTGVKASLPIAQVRAVVRQSPAALEYLARRPQLPDTLAGHWQLAEWCRERHLGDERQVHLRRVLEFDANHPQARRALGYHFLGGQWTTRADFRRGEGHEFYKGKWRTPQEIELLEAQSRLELAQQDWLSKLRRYRRDLDTPDRAKAGYEALVEIKDPIAVRPLGAMLLSEPSRRVKMLYADALANIDSAEAVGVLVDRVLNDADEEILYYCLDRLLELDQPHLADPFVVALGDASNARVNRAALALSRIRDAQTISPLIDGLITTHSRMFGKSGSGGYSMTTTLGGDGSAVKQNAGPRIVVSRVRNQHVLDALTKLTGVNFGYDQRAWRYWHAQEKIAREAGQSPGNTRRQ